MDVLSLPRHSFLYISFPQAQGPWKGLNSSVHFVSSLLLLKRLAKASLLLGLRTVGFRVLVHLRFMCRGSGQFLPTPHVLMCLSSSISLLLSLSIPFSNLSQGILSFISLFLGLKARGKAYSGVMFATPLTGEKASHVIQHCLEAWSAWGKPTIA
mgnify:CR=1 FL=1